MKKKIEILAPAKNLIQGVGAINAGADAVYIGAPQFVGRIKYREGGFSFGYAVGILR